MIGKKVLSDFLSFSIFHHIIATLFEFPFNMRFGKFVHCLYYFFLDETMAPPPPPPGLVLRMDYSSPILNSQQQSVVGVTNASKMRS